MKRITLAKMLEENQFETLGFILDSSEIWEIVFRPG